MKLEVFFRNKIIIEINVRPERNQKLCVITTRIVQLCKIFTILIPVHNVAVNAVFSLTLDFHIWRCGQHVDGSDGPLCKSDVMVAAIFISIYH